MLFASAKLHQNNQPYAKPVTAESEFDIPLLSVIMALLAIGLVMVYSASIATAEGNKFSAYQSTYFLIRHSIYLFLALGAAVTVMQVPIEKWQKWAPKLFLFGLALLILVLIPYFGKSVNGAQRWFRGAISIQPSELMKIFVLLYAADYTFRKNSEMHDLKKAFLPMAAAMTFVAIFLLKQPDFGTLVIIITIAFGILYLGGLKARLFFILFIILLALFVAMIYFSEYRRQRLIAFTDPWRDPYGKGYQLSHALIAFGRGGIFGSGLGSSVEKLYYLPEAHTDFLLAVIAEELGLIGVIIILALFVFLVQRAFAIGRTCLEQQQNYSALVAMGIGLWFGAQSFINMGVNMGLLPTKGITLPLLSYGGSAIVTNCMALGILLRIDWESRTRKRNLNVATEI